MTSRVVFACINGLHVEDAKAIARHMTSPVGFLDVNAMTIHREPPSIAAHSTPLTFRQVAGAVGAPWAHQGDTVVLPQDVSILPQLIRASCRRKGCHVALMPDGLVSESRVDTGSPWKRRVRQATYGALRATGLGSGQPGVMGSSRPDLVLGWGEGWRDVLTRSSGAQYVAVGAARLDALRRVPPAEHAAPRLLVCSQPMGALQGSDELAPRWYEFLAGLPDELGDGTQIRIRMHPAETGRSEVPVALASLPTRSLLEDIVWGTHVAAPFSTVLLEALVAGRVPIVLEDAALTPLLDRIPLFADPRLPRSSWTSGDLQVAMQCNTKWHELAEDYASDSGSASHRIAQSLELLHLGHLSS